MVKIMNIKDFAFWRKKKESKTKNLNTDDTIRILIEKACKILIEDKNFPAHICFDVPNSSYLAHIFIIKDLIHEGEWRLQVGVMEEGYDKMFSCLFSHYSKEKLLEELNSEQTKTEIFDTVKNLYIRAKQDD